MVATPSSLTTISASFAERAYRISGVQGVYVRQENDQVVHIWTVVDRDDFALRESVFQIEGTIYDDFPDAHLDFHVLTLERLGERNIKTAIPDGFVLVSRQVNNAAKS